MRFTCFIIIFPSATKLLGRFRQTNDKETKSTAGEHASKDDIIFLTGGGWGLG